MKNTETEQTTEPVAGRKQRLVMLKRVRESRSVNIANAFWSKYSICPVCRGYNLEKSWCDRCGKTGFIAKT